MLDGRVGKTALKVNWGDVFEPRFSTAKRTAILDVIFGVEEAVKAPVVLSTTPTSRMRAARSTEPFGFETVVPPERGYVFEV